MNPIQPAAMVVEAAPLSQSEMASKINVEHGAVEASARASLAHARAAGELLAAAKAQVGHGRWLAWLAEHCRVGARTAQRYMTIASRWDELTGKSDARVAFGEASLRDGLRILAEADELAALASQLTREGRQALVHGWIDEAAARQLLRLNVLNKVATAQCEVFPDGSWADRAAKSVLWRPHHARTEAEVSAAVDSALSDLVMMQEEYGDMSPEEAEQACTEALQDREMDAAGCVSPEFFWAWLWQSMRPDFARLEADEWADVVAAAERYLAEAAA